MENEEIQLEQEKMTLEEKQIVFMVNGQRYSLDINLVMSIEQSYMIIPIPDAPQYVKGMINLRGVVVPVYSLRSRFGQAELTGAEASKSQLLIVQKHGISLGFEVDSIAGIEVVEKQNHKDIPVMIKSEATSYIGDLFDIKGQIVVGISVDNIMAESEWEDLEKIVQAHSQDA